MVRSFRLCSSVLFLSGLFCAVSGSAYADLIEASAPIQGISGGGYLGQELVVPTGPNYNNITFSFISSASYAIGTGYLLNQPFFGSPASLSSAPGLLASVGATGSGSTGQGDVYAFGSNTTLIAGGQYYFYEDALIPTNPYPIGGGSVAGGYYTGYPGFGTLSPSENFSVLDGIGPAFNLTGDPVSIASSVTPEAPTWVLLGSGLLCLGGMFRKRIV